MNTTKSGTMHSTEELVYRKKGETVYTDACMQHKPL